MRSTFCIVFFSLGLSYDAFAQLPACKDSFPVSLLLNHSFEEYSGCYTDNGSTLEGGYIDGLAGFGGMAVNHWHSFAGEHHEIHYFNYNCRLNTRVSIFDSTNTECSSYPHVPLPWPDGPGFISIDEHDIARFVPESKVFKSYVTTCLSQPLNAGETYVFSFYFGFGRQYSTYCFQQSFSPYGIAIFGRQDCPVFPVNNSSVSKGCLANNPGWMQLGRISLKGENEWITGAIEFTPQTNISSIGIGPDCTNHNLDSFYYSDQFASSSAGSMYFMDKFVLATKKDYAFKTITAVSGDVCTGHFVLQAPAYTAATYQWHKDGVLIPGATSEIYTVPDKDDAQGNYVVDINYSNICLNSLPFSVIFSELNKFSLGHDIFLCDTTTVTLDAGLRTAFNYVWQDGSIDPSLHANRSGLYWVQVTDVNSCTKKDSINITIQNCDACRLFIPSAFTPNNDGLNDLFKTKPQCPDIGLQNFALRVYDRWGQLVFMTNDMNTGWDGTYKNKRLDQGVYVYLVEYSFKQKKILQQKGTITLVR